MRLFSIVIAVIFSGNVFGQVIENQYIIVPKQFQFQKKENQYQINALCKFLFEKNNFVAVWNDNLPENVVKNPCNTFKVDVKNQSNLLVTKVVLTLTDCKGSVVFTSREGKSREKDYTKAFNQAIRDAFEDVKKLKISKLASSEKEEELSVTFTEIQTTPEILQEKNYPILYAQPTENGFQLVDNTPKIVFKLQKTSLENIFNALNINNINGIFYKKENYYIFEFIQNGKQEKEFYIVKF